MFDIFVMEPEPHIQTHLASCAEQESWDIYVYADEETASRSILKYPHLWVLDMTCPNYDGPMLFRQIKMQATDVPVLLLAQSSDFDQIKQLDLQNDDFLMAPLSPAELILRTRNLLRRHYPVNNQALFRINLHPYIIDENRREVLIGTDRIDLTAKEFNLLLLLARYRGKVLSREQIVHEIWGADSKISERSVDDLVRRLRRKMMALNIETLYGYGYRMILQ